MTPKNTAVNVQVSAAQRQQAAVFFHPHSFIKFGVRAQFTDEAKINLIRSGLIPPQMRFFQEKSNGIADSAH